MHSKVCRAAPAIVVIAAVSAHAADGQDPLPPLSTTNPVVIAQAPSPNPSNNTTGDLGARNAPEPVSAPPRIGLFPQFGDTLVQNGIDFHGVILDHFFANPSAGVSTGHTSNMAQIDPAVDIDLERLIGLPGGNLHIRDTNYILRSNLPQIVNQTGGAITGYQTTPSVAKNLLSVLTYEQKLLGGRLSVEAGRTNVANYFFLPNSLDPFFYPSTTVVVDGDFNSPPFPVWGGRATYKLAPAWYFQVGAFEDSFMRTATNGQNFAVSKATGAQLLAEVGYRTDFATAAYPSNFELTFDWNTRSVPGNVKGAPIPYSPRTGARPYVGGGFIYAQGQQVVWRGARQPYGPPPNIAVFGSFAASVDKPQPIDLDALIGMNFTGLIPGRPFDALGVQTRYQRLSAVEAAFESKVARLFAGPGPDQSRDAFAFELVANVQLTPAVAIRPFVEYFVMPDAYYRGTVPGRPRSGFAAGLYASVAIGRLLGTSQKPF